MEGLISICIRAVGFVRLGVDPREVRRPDTDLSLIQTMQLIKVRGKGLRSDGRLDLVR